MGAFSYLILILCYTTSHWKCIDLTINLPYYEKMQQNPSNGESLGNWYTYFSNNMYFFSIRFPSCSILHHMGNACVSPSISHSTVKLNKTHQIEVTMKIGAHTFPVVWVFFSNPIAVLWCASSYGKCMGFPINFPSPSYFWLFTKI